MATSGPANEFGARVAIIPRSATPAARIIATLAPNSEAREVRLALLEERAHCLFRLGRSEALDEDAALIDDLLLHRLGVRGFHQALRQADGFGRQLGELARRRFRRSEQLRLGDDAGDDADFEGLLGGERLAKQQKLGGTLIASEER